MSDNSKIEWTDATWNPVTGCTKVSAGCKFCYAETFAGRQMGRFANGRKFTDIQIHPEALDIPARWKRGRKIFVNSMSDLFHPEIPPEFLLRIFETMQQNPQHIYQILTKRMLDLHHFAHITNSKYLRYERLWTGVTVESAEELWRLELLKNTRAFLKFVSFEPLLSDLPNLDLSGIDWVIVGGETGHKARLMENAWVINILNACRKYNVPFFFKQWGGRKKDSGSENFVREFPEWSRL